LRPDKASSFLVGCISLLWLYKSFLADFEFVVPAAIFAICSIFLYKGAKIARWTALLLVALNAMINVSVAELMIERPLAGIPVEVSVELQMSNFLCFLALAFLFASIWKSKPKSV
jgi:hypothetical protein